jgi:hypothetical protein
VVDAEPWGSEFAMANELAMGCCCHEAAMAGWHSEQALLPRNLWWSFGGAVTCCEEESDAVPGV